MSDKFLRNDSIVNEPNDYKRRGPPVKINWDDSFMENDKWSMVVNTFEEWVLVNLSNKLVVNDKFLQAVKPFIYTHLLPQVFLVKKKKYINFWLTVMNFVNHIRVRHSFRILPESLIECSEIFLEIRMHEDIYSSSFDVDKDKEIRLYFDLRNHNFYFDSKRIESDNILADKLKKLRIMSDNNDFLIHDDFFRIHNDNLSLAFEIFQSLNYLVSY